MRRHLSINSRPQQKQTGRDLRTCLRDIGICFLAFLFVIVSLPVVPHVMASDTTFLEVASPQPDETPTPAPTPTPDAVLEQAKREALIADELKKKAVADKERIEAEAAKLKAEVQPLGTPTVTIPTGSVQTDAAGWVESQMLAHEAAKQITQALTRNLCNGHFMRGGVAETASPTPTPSPGASPSPPTEVINTLVVYNNNDLTGVEMYNAVFGQLLKLKKSLEEENGKARGNLTKTDPETPTPMGPSFALAAAAVPGIATGVIKSVAELINLFRTDTSFTNKSVQISEDMVVSHVVKMLSANSGADGRCANAIKVYYPALFPPRLMQSSEYSQLVVVLNDVEQLKNESSLLVERIDERIEQLNKLSGQFDALDKELKAQTEKNEALNANHCDNKKKSAICKKLNAEIAPINEEVSTLQSDLAKVKKPHESFKGWVETLADQKAKMQALITSVNLLSAKLTTPDETTKLTAMAQLFRAEKLNHILEDPQAFTLRVAVTANGTTKVKKNMFVDAKVRHSAGANLVYQLFNRDGALAQGDVMQCYIDYRSANDVQRAVSSANPADMIVCRKQF